MGFRKLGDPLFSKGIAERFGLGKVTLMSGAVVSAPAKPTGLTVTPASTSQMNLAWTDAATTETAYKIYRSTDGVNYAQVGVDQAADANSYSDTPVTAGTTYYYKVAAVNAGGETLSDAVASNTLLFGVKSFWKLGEAAASTRADSVGTNTLTPSANNPTQEEGIINNAAGFVAASTQNLTATLSGVPTGSQAHSIVVWVRPSIITGTHAIFHCGASTSQYNYYILQISKDCLYRLEGSGGSGVVEAAVTNAFPSADAWHFVCVWWAGGANDIYISVDDGTPVHTALSGMTPDADALTAAFGSSANNAVYYSGRLDEAGIWDRALTSGEISALYNGGAGRTYPFS